MILSYQAGSVLNTFSALIPFIIFGYTLWYSRCSVFPVLVSVAVFWLAIDFSRHPPEMTM